MASPQVKQESYGSSTSSYNDNKRKREDTDSEEVKEHKLKWRRPRSYYKECLICCTEKPLNQYPRLKHAAAHSSDVCRKCWSRHLSTQIEDKDASTVQCPQCEQILVEPEVRKLAQHDAYQQ